MKPGTKKILNFALIFGTLLVVLLVGFNGQEMSGAIDALRSISLGSILLCLLAYAGYLLMEAASLYYYLRRQGHKVRFAYILFVSLMGLYYSNITPGATGGQPMQVYYLTKRKVPIGMGSSALTVKLFCFQFMLAVVGTVLWLIYAPFVQEKMGGYMWIFLVGYIYNCIAVAAILLMALTRRPIRFIIRWCIRIGEKMRIVKDVEASTRKWEEVQENFHSSIQVMIKRPVDLVVQLLLAGLQLLSLMTVIYFVFHAFNLEGYSYWQLTTLGVMLYTSAAYTPLPGASGAQEGVFALYFAQVFPDGIRLMALLLWRFFTYYMTLILGAIISVVFGLKTDKPPEEG